MADIFEAAFMVYVAMAMIKVMLCLPHAPLAIAVLSRLAGHRAGTVSIVYLLGVPIILVGVAAIFWPAALYHEGARFFVMYSRYSVMRSCVLAHATK